MPTTAALPPDVREQRDPARAQLAELAEVVEQIGSTSSVQDRLMAQRLALWKALRALDPPVSWADMARVCGISEVTIIQAVQGRKPKGDGS